MGVWDTIVGALGLRRPLVVREAAPVALTAGARRALAALPTGQALHVTTRAVEGGRRVAVEVGPPRSEPWDALGPVVISETDRRWLEGLQLDCSEGRWRVSLSLTVHASETPNPNGRLYRFDRILAEGPPLHFVEGATDPLAARLLAVEGVVSVLVRENTVTLVRSSADLDWGRADRSVDAAVREYLLGCGRPLVRAATSTRSDLEREILEVLEAEVLPGIHADGGDVELLGVSDDGVVRIAMTGACRGCPAAELTAKGAIERSLVAAFPHEVSSVERI